MLWPIPSAGRSSKKPESRETRLPRMHSARGQVFDQNVSVGIAGDSERRAARTFRPDDSEHDVTVAREDLLPQINQKIAQGNFPFVGLPGNECLNAHRDVESFPECPKTPVQKPGDGGPPFRLIVYGLVHGDLDSHRPPGLILGMETRHDMENEKKKDCRRPECRSFHRCSPSLVSFRLDYGSPGRESCQEAVKMTSKVGKQRKISDDTPL